MKTSHFIFVSGLFAVLTGTACAQVINPLPARVLGQYNIPKTGLEIVSPPSIAPNLVEGRELFSPQAVAVDASSNPAIVYVVDTGNHRVLGWKAGRLDTNAPQADIVLGQKDMRGTLPYTGTSLAQFGSGLYNPSAVAVDHSGNVFVMDSGNNRILRFPTPAYRADESVPQAADLVIGQADLASSSANQGMTTGATEGTIQTNSTTSGGAQLAGLAFDSEGNLWLADAGNHRVLRFPASEVSGASNVSSGGGAVRATSVLGQFDYNSNAANPARVSVPTDRLNKLQLRFPNAIAFDASGNLFVIDDCGRVVVYQPPFDTPGKAASRVLGIYVAAAGQATPSPFNDQTFTVFASSDTLAGGPSAVFTVGNYLFVSDTGANRVVRFDPVSTWAPESATEISPHMTAVFGQDDFSRGEANNGASNEPSNRYLAGPIGGAYFNGQLFLVDNRNNRVMIHPFDMGSNTIAPATGILGQFDFPFRTANLIEGREFAIGSIQLTSTLRVNLGIGVALDTSTEGQQRIYIADTANHRVLGWSDARRMKTGDRADLVIGQVDFYRSIPNSPGAPIDKANESSLLLPGGVIVDAVGNLWVADTGNGRVLRFPKPFEHPEGPFVADIVIGQPDFTTRTDGVPARNRLYRPAGLALTFDGHLVVSDIGHNRVMLFRQPFSSGQSADVVLGQPDGETAGAGNTGASLYLPMGVAIDTDDRLYVADTVNGRLAIYDRINTQFDGANAALLMDVSGGQPHGVTVSARTGEIFVSELRSGAVYRYPRFDQLAISGNYVPDSSFVFPSYGPRSVVLDPLGNLYVADTANRVTVHYPQLYVVNGMNGFPKVAPAMMGLLRAPGVVFSTAGGTASSGTLPKALGDLEVLVNGVSAPLTQTDADNVRLIVPKGAPGTGLADFVVRRVSTGEVVAFSRVFMTAVSPAALFLGANPSTSGQARAFNQDGSANGASAGVSSGQEFTVLMTGHGAFDTLPADGVAPGSAVPVPDSVRAYIRIGTAAQECTVVSSTLDPDQPGVWRVRVKAPQVTVDGSYGFVIIYKSVVSDYMTNPSLSVRPLVQVNH